MLRALAGVGRAAIGAAAAGGPAVQAVGGAAAVAARRLQTVSKEYPASGVVQAWSFEYKVPEAPEEDAEAAPPFFARSGIEELPGELFAMPPRIDLLHRAVVYQRRQWWQGTSKAKTRSEVRGGGKKPWQQKGSGRARHGSIRSPIWRGGGVVHGPRPRDHRIKLPQKMQTLALRVGLSVKYGQGDLYVVDDLDVESHKTRDIVPALEGMGWEEKTLFVGTGEKTNFERAVGNVQTVDYVDQSDLNVYQMLLRPSLVLTRSAVDALQQRLVPKPKVVRPVNHPDHDVAYVKPTYRHEKRHRQSMRPSFLPKQSNKKQPKRVVRNYPSPFSSGGKYLDRKYLRHGGANAHYLGNLERDGTDNDVVSATIDSKSQ